MKAQTIFEVLADKEICYAVGVNMLHFKTGGIKDTSKEYFVMILAKDLKGIKGANFHQSYSYKTIFEHNLTKREVDIFKSKMDNFVKVQHGLHGRIYELRGSSFKESYNKALVNEM